MVTMSPMLIVAPNERHPEEACPRHHVKRTLIRSAPISISLIDCSARVVKAKNERATGIEARERWLARFR